MYIEAVTGFFEVCQAPPLRWSTPVLYLAADEAPGVRERLAARLLEALGRVSPPWAQASSWGALKLETGAFGRPLLRLGARQGPSLSFSRAGGLVWAAMAAAGTVGLDAAPEADFAPPYPYDRAFGKREWEWAWHQCTGRAATAAALLWAAKEAAVKALGVGFHTRDFLDLEVQCQAVMAEGLYLVVKTPTEVSAWARPFPEGWLALALKEDLP